MFSQYFGHYLLNKRLINLLQLQDVLELQKSNHVKLGILAINEGFMSVEQVDETHEKQMLMDKKFGEIAIELGFLTEDQLEILLTAQNKSHLLIGQTLIDRGYLTLKQYSEALINYKKDHSLSDEQFQNISNGDIETLINRTLTVGHPYLRDVYIDYLSLFAKNMIRFIDDQTHIEAQPFTEPEIIPWLVTQKISGDMHLWTGIATDESLFLHIASKFAQEEFDQPDEYAQASISEFLNLHNGLFLVNMSNQNIELDMEPQKVHQDAQLIPDTLGYIVSVHSSSRTFYLILSNQLQYV